LFNYIIINIIIMFNYIMINKYNIISKPTIRQQATAIGLRHGDRLGS